VGLTPVRVQVPPPAPLDPGNHLTRTKRFRAVEITNLPKYGHRYWAFDLTATRAALDSQRQQNQADNERRHENWRELLPQSAPLNGSFPNGLVISHAIKPPANAIRLSDQINLTRQLDG
jgi:hypothetical protein